MRAGAATVPIPLDVEAEAPLRASAVAIEAGERLCIVATDTLTIPSDLLQAAAERIVAETGVPFASLLICATHTHHAPCTIDIFGCTRDAEFCEGLANSIVEAAVEACRALEKDVELVFSESQEATVGQNSRYLLRDGTIAWYNYRWDDVVRPTGPFDPDLPVFALRRPGGVTVATLFNHTVHNIGALTQGAVSPAFSGLAAQELERRHGGVAIFLPGAFGSTHNTSPFAKSERDLGVSSEECVLRMVGAVEQGLRRAEPMPSPSISAIKRPFTYRLRSFDEEKEEAAVQYWAETYEPGSSMPEVFRDMRAAMAPVQGQERQTWLQTIRLGDVALVGIPGEMFAALGMEIRRRSPFRNTYVVGLANDTLGYIGDRDSYELGGYQLWAGGHSVSEPGTGEALVEEALGTLRELHDDAGAR
jgi:hypothetical protein